MDPSASATTTKIKGVTNKMPIVLTDISAILGLLMLIMSFAYLFIAVSVTKENTQTIRDCSCKKDPKKIADCLVGFRRGPINSPVPNQTIDPNKVESKGTINRFCRNMNQEILAGTCGILFGLFQTVVASVFLLAGLPDALKLMWIVVHAVIAFVCIVIVLLVFDVILYKFLNRELAGTSIFFPDEFLHDGSPTSATKGNTVVFVYLAFVFLDAVATLAGIGLMALTKPNGRVVNIVKPVSNEVFLMESEPEPAVVVDTNYSEKRLTKKSFGVQ